LDSAPGAYLKCGDEQVEMEVGQLWWFDNKVLHSAYNGSSVPRVHLIFDLLQEERTDQLIGHSSALAKVNRSR
jgi:hypothetical protein